MQKVFKYDFGKSEIVQHGTDVDKVWTYLNKIFSERIVVLDGAMGTEI